MTSLPLGPPGAAVAHSNGNREVVGSSPAEGDIFLNIFEHLKKIYKLGVKLLK